MSDGSSIEWCDATWQPVLGCTRVSPGCDHCYAISVVHRGMSPQHRGLTKLRPKDASRPGVDWNGTVRLQPEKLAEPLRWKKPRRVFVCSLADLFHDAVPFEYIAAVFGVMAATPIHTYLVLTKRPERAREFFSWLERARQFIGRKGAYAPADYCGGALFNAGQRHVTDEKLLEAGGVAHLQPWPLENVHLGTSVEDQQRADERIPALLDCPADLHWLSIEPQLGFVDVSQWLGNGEQLVAHVILGGESGPGARPFDIAWARALIRQCRDAVVPVFVKQLGAKPIESCARCRGRGIRAPGGGTDPDWCGECAGGTPWALELADPKGGKMHQWPEDLRVRELPEVRT